MGTAPSTTSNATTAITLSQQPNAGLISASVLGPLMLAAAIVINAIFIPRFLPALGRCGEARDDKKADTDRQVGAALMAASTGLITTPVFNVVVASVFAVYVSTP